MDIERPRLNPGLYKKCDDCRKQLKDGPFPQGYPCRATWAPEGYPLQPKINVEDGILTDCNSYRPNLATLIKTLPQKIPVFLRAIQLSLPR